MHSTQANVRNFRSSVASPNIPATTAATWTASFPTKRRKTRWRNGFAEHGRTQFHTAETEKYPHVTFFMNGGREAPVEGEETLYGRIPQGCDL